MTFVLNYRAKIFTCISGPLGKQRWRRSVFNQCGEYDISPSAECANSCAEGNPITKMSGPQIFGRGYCHQSGQYLPLIGEDGVCLITLKLIQATCPYVMIHLRVCAYAFRFFSTFGRALFNHKIIMYHFGIVLSTIMIFALQARRHHHLFLIVLLILIGL